MTIAVRPTPETAPPRWRHGRRMFKPASPTLTRPSPCCWAGDTFGAEFAITSSMADGLLAHLASRVIPGVNVVFLDTGYHFAETIGTRDWITGVLPTLVNVTPPQTVAEQDPRSARSSRPRPRPLLLDGRSSAWRRRCRLRGLGLRHPARRVADPRRTRSSSTGTPSAAWSRSTRWPPGHRTSSTPTSPSTRCRSTRCSSRLRLDRLRARTRPVARRGPPRRPLGGQQQDRVRHPH